MFFPRRLTGVPLHPTHPLDLVRFLPLAAALLAVLVPAAAAQSPGSYRTVIPRVEGRAVIDGRLNEPMWSAAAQITDFVQVEPGELVSPSRRSVAYLAYDDHYLYFAFEAFEERPEDVRATLFQRERGGETDDRVTLLLDTFNDRRRAYEFRITPYGIQWDGVKLEGSGTDASVDFVWHSAGTLTADGWTVEAMIPFASLRFPADDTLTFGFNVMRDYGRSGERDSWFPRRRGWPCDICQQGEITGITGVARRRTVDVLPYVSARSDGARQFSDTNVMVGTTPHPVQRPLGFRIGSPRQSIGGDVRLAVTPAVVLHGTINPDFSQIEADEDQIRVGQRFALGFDERRPFFLEGRDVFESGGGGGLGSMFYSRAIAEPDAGARITARDQGITFGTLYARDAAPAYWWNDGYQRSGYVARGIDRAEVLVVRARRDVLADSYVGAIALGRAGGGARNGVAGVDFSLRSGAFMLSGEGALSNDRAPLLIRIDTLDSEGPVLASDTSTILDGRERDGHYYRLQLSRAGRHLEVELSAAGASEDFRHQLGRFSRVGISRYEAEVELTQYPNSRWFRRTEQSLSVRTTHRYGGGLLDYTIQPEISFELQRQSSFDIGIIAERVTLPDVVRGVDVPVDVVALTLSASTDASRVLSASAFLLAGERELYDFSDPRPGAGYIANLRATIRPFAASAFQLSWQRSVRQDAWGEETIDRATLSRVRATHQFTRAMGIRVIAEHSDQFDSQEVNPFSRRGVRMGWSALLHWEFAPASLLYVGGADELREFDARVSADRLIRTGASVFVKASYLVRL
jgi:hypothetical protein